MKRTTLILIVLLVIACSFAACDYFAHASHDVVTVPVNVPEQPPAPEAPDSLETEVYVPSPLLMSPVEKTIVNAGLIDIKTIDTTIVVDLKYSTVDNFLGMDVYGDLDKCYLQPDVASKLKVSQELLRSRFPFYNLIVFDAARSRSIQSKMWDTIDVPYFERSKYISNPRNGSLHNFGAAVDVSIIDEQGIELDMGTPYDHFGELAYPREEERMLEEGKLTHIQFLNRELLRSVMEGGGFMGITTEWWHFNSCYRAEAYEKYKIIE